MHENDELMYLLACFQAAVLKNAGFKNLEKAAELFNDALDDDLSDDINAAAEMILETANTLRKQHPKL